MASKAIQRLNSGNNCWASIWNEWKESYEWKEGEYNYGVSFSDSCPIPLLVQTDLTIFNIVWMQWNIFDQIHLFLTMLKARFDIIICPPIYLYLIFTIFEFEIIPVWWTWFLVYFKLEFYRLQWTEKCSSNKEKNAIHQTWYFKVENCKNQVQIDKGYTITWWCKKRIWTSRWMWNKLKNSSFPTNIVFTYYQFLR